MVGFESTMDLIVLGVNLDSKLSFEDHIWKMVLDARRKMGVVCKAKRFFTEPSAVTTCVKSFVLALLEYCSPKCQNEAL